MVPLVLGAGCASLAGVERRSSYTANPLELPLIVQRLQPQAVRTERLGRIGAGSAVKWVQLETQQANSAGRHSLSESGWIMRAAGRRGSGAIP
jgi:hypothetical protein